MEKSKICKLRTEIFTELFPFVYSKNNLLLFPCHHLNSNIWFHDFPQIRLDFFRLSLENFCSISSIALIAFIHAFPNLIIHSQNAANKTPHSARNLGVTKLYTVLEQWVLSLESHISHCRAMHNGLAEREKGINRVLSIKIVPLQPFISYFVNNYHITSNEQKKMQISVEATKKKRY